jgi:acetyl-CoA carboxylase biotin carboxyl carrier protein
MAIDAKLILAMLDKFNEGSVEELEYTEDGGSIVLRKAVAVENAGQPAATTSVTVKNSAAPAAPAGAAPAAGGPAPGDETITSPIVATFYGAPSEGAAPFVKPGDKVKAGDTLCILEAMKMMNHLEAEFDCEIVKVLAKAGDLVEFGQALFEVKRS